MIDRYTRPEMGHIFSLQNKYAIWQKIGVLACEAHAELGGQRAQQRRRRLAPALRVRAEPLKIFLEGQAAAERVCTHCTELGKALHDGVGRPVER